MPGETINTARARDGPCKAAGEAPSTKERVTMPATDTLTLHYTRLADSYDQFLYYSDDFVRRQTDMMIDKLRLRPTDRFRRRNGRCG